MDAPDISMPKERPRWDEEKAGLGDAIAAHPGFSHSEPLNAREGQRTN